LIKVEEIEHHSEICVSYLSNIDNSSYTNKLNNSLNKKNKYGEPLIEVNEITLDNQEKSTKNKINTNNYCKIL
jgi:hypothetical protein